MKKLFFLITLFIAFGTISAQEKLTKEEKERREKNIQAGNPFIKYGCKAPVATLSKGKYLEVHDLDSIVTIGTSRWDVGNKKIVGNIVLDSLNVDAQPIGDIPGRWMSADPLSEEFPDWSPYVSFNNNPVKFTDPTGMATEDCCDDLLNFVAGTIAGTVSNLTGSNYLRSGEHTSAFNNGARVADSAALVGGSYLTAKGLADTTIGGTGMAMATTATVGSGGLAIEVTAPAFVESAKIATLGIVETAYGGFITNNAKNNMENDSSSGNGNSSNSEGTRKTNPKKEAREAGKVNRENQPGSEKRAKDYAKQLEKESGKDARRTAHDAKDNIGRDRTVKELKEDYNRK